jgi:hypothetical protein
MEDLINEKMKSSSGLQVKVDQLDLGTSPPSISGFRMSTLITQGYDGIELEFAVRWNCECDIKLRVISRVGDIALAVKFFKLSAKANVVLCPLVDVLPIVGGAQVSMLAPPIIDWKFEGAAAFTELPVVNSAIRSAITDIFQKELVLPNRVFIPAPEISLLGGRLQVGHFEKDLTSLRFPAPLAFFELGVVEAKDLLAMDFNFLAAPSSDPFAVVRLGGQEKQTPVVEQNLNPKWGDEGYMEFPIYSAKQLVVIEVFDKDHIKNNDLIGRIKGEVKIADILAQPGQFWELTSEASGKAEPAGKIKLDAVLYRLDSKKASLVRHPSKKTPSCAYLTIHVRALRGLRESLCTGSTLEIGVKGADRPSFKTKRSKMGRMKNKDVSCEPEAQRMLEYLVMEQEKPLSELARVSGLPEEELKSVLQARKSFQCGWYQGFAVEFEDPSKGEISIQLVTPVEAADSAIPRAELKMPYKIATLMDEEEMTWEGFLRLDRTMDDSFTERSAQIAGVDVGPLDLEVKFQMYGFVPHDLDSVR